MLRGDGVTALAAAAQDGCRQELPPPDLCPALPGHQGEEHLWRILIRSHMWVKHHVGL